jgi:hypothetical protein
VGFTLYFKKLLPKEFNHTDSFHGKKKLYWHESNLISRANIFFWLVILPSIMTDLSSRFSCHHEKRTRIFPIAMYLSSSRARDHLFLGHVPGLVDTGRSLSSMRVCCHGSSSSKSCYNVNLKSCDKILLTANHDGLNFLHINKKWLGGLCSC